VGGGERKEGEEEEIQLLPNSGLITTGAG